ncbi:MAG: hypothetical protein ABI704_06515 [Kofleriaceae bacterium]
MRWSLPILVAGCHTSPSASPPALQKPDPVAFAKLDAEAQCAASFPRARPCVNEILKAELATVTDGELKVGSGFDEPASDREQEAMQRLHCLGEPAYPKAVVECWSVEGCEAFATCVAKHEPEMGSGSNHVR